VSLCGPRRDAEAPRYLIIRASGGDQLDHLKLPIRDHRRPLVQDCDHGGEANSSPGPRLLTRRRNFRCTSHGVPAARTFLPTPYASRYDRLSELLGGQCRRRPSAAPAALPLKLRPRLRGSSSGSAAREAAAGACVLAARRATCAKARRLLAASARTKRRLAAAKECESRLVESGMAPRLWRRRR
jgi:hypothetical protein